MAGDVTESENERAVFSTKFRCCAQQKSAKICVCIICNALYHSSCSGRVKNLQKVDNLFVICCLPLTSKRNNTEINSDVEDSEDVLTLRKVIASLKSQIAEYKSKTEEKIDEEENNDYLIVPGGTTSRTSSYGDLGDACKGCDHLKGENRLLRELINEVKDKNKLLEEKNANLCENTNIQGANNVLMRYADVANNQGETSRQIKTRTPAVIVKPIKTQRSDKTIKEIQSIVDCKNSEANVTGVKEMKNGGIVIRCNSQKDAQLVTQEIERRVGKKYSVETETLANPSIKIVGIYDEYTVEELEENIIRKNCQGIENPEAKVVNTVFIENKGTFTAYAEVNTSVYARINKSRRVFIGWQSCAVYDNLNMRKCLKCCGYGHSVKKCTAEVACLFCAGNHETKACEKKDQKKYHKCINCERSNLKFKTERSVSHAANADVVCETYKSRKAYLISKTNYPPGALISE